MRSSGNRPWYFVRMRKWIVSITIVMMFAGLAHAGMTLPAPVPARALDGERLFFDISWAGIPAAEAVLKVDWMGKGTVRFNSAVKTLPVVNLLYPMNTKIDSHVDVDGFRPTYYHKWGRDGWDKTKDRKIRYEGEPLQSFYFKDDKLRRTLDVPANIQDPLSALYLFRTSEMVDGEDFKLDINDGRKNLEGAAILLGREEVTVPAGTFKTMLVEAKIKQLGGVFKDSPGARLLFWVTDDEWRTPVKIESEVAVGRFTIELVRFEPPKPIEKSDETAGLRGTTPDNKAD